ncbi:MAG: hypothetical protein KDN20_14465 [Verrucomicrobiae bacterium]|nr:hypothetical protein [Verrucomicrobiae bacterium]
MNRPLLFLLAALLLSSAQASTPTVAKLLSPPRADHFAANFGNAVACNDRWLVIGEPRYQAQATGAGAVHVYDARTRRYLRLIVDEETVANDEFGTSVAVFGDLALIGSRNGDGIEADSGTAYLYHLPTGRRLQKLQAPAGTANAEFGYSVALTANSAIVGEPQGAALAGAVHVFDIESGNHLAEIIAPGGNAGHRFGQSIAASGGQIVIGAPNAGQLVAGSGDAYVFELINYSFIRNLVPLDAVTGDLFGSSVALDGHIALVGATSRATNVANTGAAFLIDTRTGTVLHTLSSGEGIAADQFGSSVSISGSLAAVGARRFDLPAAGNTGAAYVFSIIDGSLQNRFDPSDRWGSAVLGHSITMCGDRLVVGGTGTSERGSGAGSVYIWSGISTAFPMQVLAAKGNTAPGTSAAAYSGFQSAVLSPMDTVGFTAATSNRSVGLFENFTTSGLRALTRTGILAADLDPTLAAATITGLSSLRFNQADALLSQLTVKGPAITSRNNRLLARHDGTAWLPLIQTGQPSAALGGLPIARMGDVVQSQDSVATTFTLQTGGSITRVNDSGVLIMDPLNGVPDTASLREGDISLIGTVGQTASRFCLEGNSGLQPVFLDFGSGPLLSLVHSILHGGAGVRLVSQGDAADGGGTYRSFLAESISPTNALLHRASLTGVPAAKNEGVWHNNVGLIASKGDPAPVTPSTALWKRFLGVWAVGDQEVLILAQFSGRGITSRNDCALLLRQSSGQWITLLREGDAIPNGEIGRIGTIQRVELQPENGHYLVLTSLSGAPASSNQALFVGQLSAGDSSQPGARLPSLRLRKGSAYLATLGASTQLKSLAPLTSGRDATGAGSKGLAAPLNGQGSLLLNATFTSAANVLIQGRP